MELMNTRMFEWRDNKCSGISKYMDVVVLNKNCILFHKKLEDAKTIFINTREKEEMICKFMNEVLPNLSHPVNVIIGGEDYTFPNNTDFRMNSCLSLDKVKEFKELGNHPYINKIFVENLDESIQNAFPIPLGINRKECPVFMEYFLKFENINSEKPLKVTNFNRTRDCQGQWKERGDVLKLCKNEWNNFCIVSGEKSHEEYLKEMSKYSFTLCVHGGGLDVNPKLWEALLVGVIPIIRENKPYTNIYLELDFPVVILKKWEDSIFTEQELIKWHRKYYWYFTNETKRKQMLESLTLEYWVNYVNKIS